MKTAIITDSNSGISQKKAEEMGIFLLPMPVIIDGEIRFEGIDLDDEEFYLASFSRRCDGFVGQASGSRI